MTDEKEGSQIFIKMGIKFEKFPELTKKIVFDIMDEHDIPFVLEESCR